MNPGPHDCAAELVPAEPSPSVPRTRLFLNDINSQKLSNARLIGLAVIMLLTKNLNGPSKYGVR